MDKLSRLEKGMLWNMVISPVPGLLVDAGVTIALFVHWLVVGIIVDETGNSEGARKAASMWLAIATLGTNAFTLARSYLFLTSGGDPSRRPETVIGMFCEIVSLAQGWGTLFCVVRVWGLYEDGVLMLHPFHTKPFLHNIANSIFEMSLVQAGVGWAAEAPITVGERIAAWCAAYVGGILCVNLFLVSLVFGRRGWWTNEAAPTPPRGEFMSLIRPAGSSVQEWQLQSLVR